MAIVTGSQTPSCDGTEANKNKRPPKFFSERKRRLSLEKETEILHSQLEELGGVLEDKNQEMDLIIEQKNQEMDEVHKEAQVLLDEAKANNLKMKEKKLKLDIKQMYF